MGAKFCAPLLMIVWMRHSTAQELRPKQMEQIILYSPADILKMEYRQHSMRSVHQSCVDITIQYAIHQNWSMQRKIHSPTIPFRLIQVHDARVALLFCVLSSQKFPLLPMQTKCTVK